MADSGYEEFDRPTSAPPTPFWVDRDWSEGPMATMGLDPNDPKVQQKLQAADQSKFYKPGMNLRRYDEEIKPLLKGNPYTQQLRGSSKMKKSALGGDSGYAQFNIGRQVAGFGDVAPQWLTPAGQRAAQGFKGAVSPEQMNKTAKKLADAHQMQKNMQIAQTLISLAASGAGAWMAGIGAGPLTTAAVQGGIGAAGAAAKGGISGNFDPAGIAVDTAVGALPAVGGMGGAAMGMNPMISGAITGAAGPLVSGAYHGNINPTDILTGAATGGISGAAQSTMGPNGTPQPGVLPKWAAPLINAGVKFGAGAIGGSKGSGKPNGQQIVNTAQGIGQSVLPNYAKSINPYA